jgi:hypothetical protein
MPNSSMAEGVVNKILDKLVKKQTGLPHKSKIKPKRKLR